MAVTDEEALALGRRAVACASWRWLPGMLDTTGIRVAGVLADGRPGLRDGFGFVAVDGCIPDLRDAATVGCLLALVREGWAVPGVYARESSRGGWGVMVRKLDPCGPVVAGPFRAQTEAGALVLALESAPAKTSPAWE